MTKIKILAVALCLILLAGACKQKQVDFGVHPVDGKRCMELTTSEPVAAMEENRLQVENEFSIQWPDEGSLTPELEQALIHCTFGDTAAKTLDEAAEHFLNQTGFGEYDSDIIEGIKSVKTIDSITLEPHNYAHITSTCQRDDNLVTFSVYTEGYRAFAAHGYYVTDIMTIDLNTNRILRLEDLIDTTGLGEVLIRALEDLEVNREEGNTTECLFEEYKERLPLPDCFFIDSTRSVITAVYNQYSVQPYACGQLYVHLPIFWLSKHIPFTPYAKEIFGPGSSLCQL